MRYVFNLKYRGEHPVIREDLNLQFKPQVLELSERKLTMENVTYPKKTKCHDNGAHK